VRQSTWWPVQLFFAPAAAQAFISATAWAFVLGPPGGMLPPYQVKQEPLLTSGEFVPLMYRWLESQE
jgi:hypothetical protein